MFVPWLVSLADLVLPRSCVGCDEPSLWWCGACAASVDVEPQRILLDGGRADPLPCAFLAPYRGPAGRALVALKERGARGASAPMAAALARAVRASVRDVVAEPGVEGVVLVPVPSRPAAVRARGADVVAGLARAVARELARDAWPVVAVPALRHRRAVGDQAGLDAERRERNLAGALVVRPLARPLLERRLVVVVDDVLTTGATLREAARALRSGAGPTAVVVGATIAGTGRRVPSSRTGGTDTVVPWHSPGSVVAPGPRDATESRTPSFRSSGKPMPAAGETAHVRRLFVDRSRCGLGISPASPGGPMPPDPREGQ